MKKKIIHFYASDHPNINLNMFDETIDAILLIDDNIHTSCISLISFDLLEKYTDIKLFHKNKWYNLKLGNAEWCGNKHLRKEHNLYKLILANILT
jgi:hypothetical protein